MGEETELLLFFFFLRKNRDDDDDDKNRLEILVTYLAAEKGEKKKDWRESSFL